MVDSLGRKWSKEKVINSLQELAEKHGESYLQDSNLNENECSLYSAARKYFDSLEEAVEEAGFDYEDIRDLILVNELDGMLGGNVVKKYQS